MKKTITKRTICIFLAVLTILSSFGMPAAYAAEEVKLSNSVQAQKYNMDLTLDTKKDTLTQKVRIKVKNDSDKPVKELYFRNIAHSVIEFDKKEYNQKVNKNKKSVIKSVSVKGTGKLKVNYKKDKSVFYVKLKKPLKPNKTAIVTIKAKTDIPMRDDRFGYRKTKDGKQYCLSFCFPYLAPNKNGKWNKDPFFDDGETRASEITNYDVTFRAPKRFKVAASGTQTTKKGVTKINARKMRDFAIVACDFMEKETFKVQNVTVNSYYLPGKYQKKFRKLSKLVATDAINLYTEKIGECPYKELDMLPCFFGFSFGGMEYPGLIMNNATSYYGKGTISAKSDPYSLRSVISHEIAHQWFFAAVGNNEYREGWLDEGFTTYCERAIYDLADTKSLRYANSYSDPKIDNDRIKQEYAELIADAHKDKTPNYVNIPVNKYGKNDSYGEREYEYGFMFLCELELVMGEENFSRFLKEYYNKYKFKIAKTKHLLKLIRKIDNSDEVNAVIKKYVNEKYL